MEILSNNDKVVKPSANPTEQSSLLFDKIVVDIANKGYSINPAALPLPLAEALLELHCSIDENSFNEAGVGRGENFRRNDFVRTDKIHWINKKSDAGNEWLEWTDELRLFLNRHLFLGLFSFESHFAKYQPGSFYKRHQDAFKGEANRILSVVVYLNSGWTKGDGGELVLYHDTSDHVGTQVVPLMGTVVVFLSEEFPHEVLPALRDRYSIAGWFRVNSSGFDKVDPPR